MLGDVANLTCVRKFEWSDENGVSYLITWRHLFLGEAEVCQHAVPSFVDYNVLRLQVSENDLPERLRDHRERLREHPGRVQGWESVCCMFLNLY